MTTKQVLKAKTAEQAKNYAIAWQQMYSDKSMSYREASDWQTVFTLLAHKFNLTAEFKENGII